MKIIISIILLGCLVVGSFYLGYNSETTVSEKEYAKKVMTEKSASTNPGRSIGAFEGQ